MWNKISLLLSLLSKLAVFCLDMLYHRNERSIACRESAVNPNMKRLIGNLAETEKQMRYMEFEVLGKRLDHVDRRLDGMEQRFTSVEGKLEQMLQQLATLTTKPQNPE